MKVTGQKRKYDYYSDEKNVYIKRKRKGGKSSKLPLSASVGETSRKPRKREGGLRWSKSPEEDAKDADWKIEVRYFPTATPPLIETNKNSDGNETPATKDKIIVDPPPKATELVTYSVHRSTLVDQSEYFERMSHGGYAESIKQKITIELPTPMVTPDHFEIMLDFCYTEAAFMKLRQRRFDHSPERLSGNRRIAEECAGLRSRCDPPGDHQGGKAFF
jgi:hypothetical protein